MKLPFPFSTLAACCIAGGICLTPAASAQTPEPAPSPALAPAFAPPSFRMGLSIGPNLGHLASRDLTHQPAGVGFGLSYALNLDFLFDETYAIGSGVNIFTVAGTEEHLALDTSGTLIRAVERTVRNQYVELPFTLKMRTREIGYTTLYGRFGAGLGINLRSTADTRTADRWRKNPDVADPPGWQLLPGEFTTEPLTSDFSATTPLFRPSFIVGLGAERRLTGRTALVAGLEYNVGFTSAYRDESIVRTGSADVPLDASGSSLSGSTADPALVATKGHAGALTLVLGVVF